MLLPKEIENKFGIYQQLRAKIDRAYDNFIRYENRQYSDSDVLAYELIFQYRKDASPRKVMRPEILTFLAKQSQNGIIPFYPSEMIPSLEDLLDKEPTKEIKTEKANGKPRKQAEKKPVTRTSESMSMIIELAEKVGYLTARLEEAEKEIIDLHFGQNELREQSHSQQKRIARLETQLLLDNPPAPPESEVFAVNTLHRRKM